MEETSVMEGTEQTTVGVIVHSSFRPLIEAYFRRISAEQWSMLRAGSPDTATKCMLADLILELIMSFSRALLEAFNTHHLTVSAENVEASLSETLPQTLFEVLDIPQEASLRCKSSERLTATMSAVVWEMVESARSGSAKRSLFACITAPKILNRMVCDACRMFKVFMAKMKTRGSSPKFSSLRESEATPSDKSRQTLSPPKAEVRPHTSSGESSLKASPRSAQSIIQTSVEKLINPLLSEVSEEECEELQAETSLEIELISEQVAEIISQESDSAARQVESPDACVPSAKRVGGKIRNFFANVFFKAWLQRTVAQLRSHLKCQSEPEPESIQSLADSIRSLLSENGRVSLTDSFNIPEEQVLVHSEEVRDLLYTYVTTGTTEVPESLTSGKTVCVPKSHATLFGEIPGKVWSLIVLMNWWMKTQVGLQTRKVTLALTSPESPVLTPRSEPLVPSSACEDSTAPTDRNKVFVRILVEKLYTRILKRAKVNHHEDHKHMVDQLDKMLWAELEGETFTRRKFKKLDKVILKDLRKRWGPADEVLLHIMAKDAHFFNSLAQSFRKHLTKPVSHCHVCRFLTSVGRVITKPFTALFRRR